MHTSLSLGQLGWRSHCSQQLTLEDLDTAWPARVASVHRGAIVVLGERGECCVTLAGHLAADPDLQVTVGDWVMIENAAPRICRVLERFSYIARIGAGTQRRLQSIAANVDTLFVVTSCNADFNASRLERYLAVAHEAGVEPVIVLTKVDLCADVSAYTDEAKRITARASIVPVNATSDDASRLLVPWLGSGQSVAFVGSSGVGKSTLVNTLSGTVFMATGGIREADAKGRHTTSARQLIAMAGGAWLIDTPGMRELQVGAIDAGIRAVFDDVEALARSCRFRDCRHQADDGCALSAAIESGKIDPRRVRSYLKLQREAANAARAVHERHRREREFGKLRKAQKAQQKKEREGK
jgi:ribosome biogenesis GTPase / thiamine phosphate phosphatase